MVRLSVENAELTIFRYEILFVGRKPCVEKDLSFDKGSDTPPRDEIFFIAREITAVPDSKKVVIRAVSDAFTVIEDMFDVGVIKEGFNEIAALLAVRMGLKKRGDFFSVVFQRKTVAEEFVLLVRRVVIRKIVVGIKVVPAYL